VEQKPPTQLGLAFGLVVILALILLDIGLVVLVLTAPVTPLTVLRVVLVLLNVAVLGLVLYSLLALNSAGYQLDRSALSIRWGPTLRVIPLSEVEGILHGIDLGAVTRFRGLHWPGFWSGRGRIENVGTVEFFSTGPLERQLVIKTAAGGYAISPHNPDRFVDRFAAFLRLGPEEAEPPQATPPAAPWPLLSDRFALGLLAAGGLLNLLVITALTIRLDDLPYRVPFRFGPTGEVLLVGSPGQLLVIAGVATGLWALNGVVGAVLYHRLGERMAGYLLWGGALALQLFLAGALWHLVKV
jgi:hypothetical protein